VAVSRYIGHAHEAVGHCVVCQTVVPLAHFVALFPHDHQSMKLQLKLREGTVQRLRQSPTGLTESERVQELEEELRCARHQVRRVRERSCVRMAGLSVGVEEERMWGWGGGIHSC
jgi:hypothetical protein